MSQDAVKWNVGQYSKFINERTRPAAELLGRVELETAKTVVDLGCGPGNSTALLKHRWPHARVIGIDNSDEMLSQAKASLPDFEFQSGDISDWHPENTFDVIFSNAALQWVPNHEQLLPRLAELINANGYFAMQVPNNHMEPTHRAMRDVAGDHRWSVDLSKTRRQPPVLAPQKYYDLLRPYFETIDIWETRYFHEMDSYEAIAEWLKGTGLRPFIAQLAATEQNQFLALFIDELRKHYDVQSDKKLLLPFPRLFIVAQRWKVLSRNQ